MERAYLPADLHTCYIHAYLRTYIPNYIQTDTHVHACMHKDALFDIIRSVSQFLSCVFNKRKEVQEPKAVKGSSSEIIERTVRILRGKTWWRPGTYVGLFVVAERFWHVRTLVTLQNFNLWCCKTIGMAGYYWPAGFKSRIKAECDWILKILHWLWRLYSI